jgi:hypothetical protein
MRTLFEYSALDRLEDKVRDKYTVEMIGTILDDKDKYHNDIEEMIDYFITELGNADFIRMYEKIMEKRIK